MGADLFAYCCGVNNGVWDTDAARAEQRAGKKYQETKENRQRAEDLSTEAGKEDQLAARKYYEQKEREQNAYDLSTEAALDEKFSLRKALASPADGGYTESEQGSPEILGMAAE